ARPRFTLLLPVLIEASQNRITHFTTARSWSPAADAFACTTRRSTSACPSPARPSASKKSTMASGWLVLWITISAILIWRKKPCSPCRTPSGQKCNLCLRHVLLPMSPERTFVFMVAGGGFEPPTFGLCDLIHLSMRVGLYLHPRGVLPIQSLRLPPNIPGAWFGIAYRSRDVGSTDFDE